MNTSANKPDLLRVAFCVMLISVPLIYVPEIFLYTRLPKRTALFICTALATIGWWWRIRKTQALSWPTNPATGCLMGLIATVAISFWQTTHPLDSLVEFAYQLTLISLFFISASALTTHDLSALLRTNVAISIVIGIMGILQFHDLAFVQIPSTGHPAATFGYRNFAAMYLICALPLAVLYFLWSTSRLETSVALIATTSMAIFLIYTRTRGAWGGLALGFLVLLTFLINRSHRTAWFAAIRPALTKEKVILSIIALLFVGGLAPMSPQFVDKGLQRFDEKKANITTTVASVFQSGGDRSRSQMWANTLNLITDHPITGVGPSSWKRSYPPYDQGMMIRPNTSPVRPHNDYLWVAAEYGLPGLVFYLGFFAALLYAAYQSPQGADPLAVVSGPFIAVTLIAFLGHSFFSFPKEQPQAALFVYLFGGLLIASRSKRMRPHLTTRLLLALVIVQTVGASALYYAYMRFDRHYLYALVAEDHNDWQNVQREVRQALSWGNFRSHAWIIAGRASERQENFPQAEADYKKALLLSPNGWHAHNGLGIALKRQERYEEAKHHYLEALKYFPGVYNANGVEIRTNLGALYKSMGNLVLAEQMYQQVLTTQPENAGANNNMANFYKARGQLDSALVAYQMALKTDSTQVQGHFNISDLYIKKGQYDNALHHAEKAARLQPTNPRLLWHLGQVLEANQRSGDAEKAYLLALSHDPEYTQAYFNLGNLLFEKEDCSRAKPAFQAFLQLWKGDSRFKDFAQERLNHCNNELSKKK